MSRRILLADDSVTIQKVIELTFMEEDYEVVAAGDGDEALARLDEIEPDFVIADVHMPGASGLDVCRRSKQLHPEVPVLLLVGTFEPFDEDEARSAGADAHLKKPFDSQELLQLVDDLMGPEREAAPAPAAAAAGEPEGEADSTWRFDVAGEEEEEQEAPSAEPEPSEEPEWAAAAGEEPEWAAPTEEPEWAVPAAEAPSAEPEPSEEPEWAAAPAGVEERDERPEPPAGEVEWGPLDPQPAEVAPPAVGQVEAGAPVWDRPYGGGPEPAPGAREPFELGAREPRHRGHQEVFDLGAGEEAAEQESAEEESAEEPAAAEVAEAPVEAAAAGPERRGGYGAGDPGWGFAVEEGASEGEPAEAESEEPGESDREVAAAGFRWDEPEEPSSQVVPPDEQDAGEPEALEAEAEEPEVAAASEEEPAWGEPDAFEEPEVAAAAPEEPPAEAPPSAEEPAWGEPDAFEEPEEPSAAAVPYAAEPGAEEPDATAPAVPGSGASYGGADVSAEPPGGGAPASAGLSDGDVERIARRVAELLGDRVTREVAWEVVPDLAEVVIRERLRELEGQLD